MSIEFDFLFAQIAQSVEQRTENPCVGGSIPPLGTIKILIFCSFYLLTLTTFEPVLVPEAFTP